MDLMGPNGKVQLRFTHDAESYYENEEENISEQIETYYQGGEGEDWKIPAQVIYLNSICQKEVCEYH